MSKSKLFLLDGMALAYRSYYAFINSNLKNSEGIPTGAILGFANTLVKMLEDEEPTHIAVAWDTSAPTFRHEMDENYKANRPPQPEDLRVGIPLIKEMITAFGMENIEKDGYEADDLIGTIADRANEEDVNVYLVTPDKDFMQLVHDHVTMYKPLNNADGFKLIDREGVKEYFGVYPEKVIDVLAMIGDTSDNIPGVPGIGKKGAPKLIKKYGTLEAAIEDAENIKGKRAREGLMNHGEQALKSKKMVTIETEVPATIKWEKLEWDGPQKDELAAFFKRMEFKTIIRKFLGEEYLSTTNENDQGDLFQKTAAETTSSVASYDEGTVDYTLIDTEEALHTLVEHFKEKQTLCFDTETTGTDPMKATLLGISLAAVAGSAYYIPVEEKDGRGLPIESALDTLRPLFESGKKLIAHHYKYDQLMLERYGISPKCTIFDTMIAAYLLDPNQKLKMDSLSEKYLSYKPVPIENLIGKGKKQKSMQDVDMDTLYIYACEDADITYRLYEILSEKLEEHQLQEIAEDIEFPLIPVLSQIERNGMLLDREMLDVFSDMLQKDLKEIQAEIYEKAGTEFNINSPKQLGEVLFEKMELPAGKKTKTGQYSTAESVLSKLANEYEVPALVLDYRSISKLDSTYVSALPKLIHPKTGRIHTDINQHIAATGRLSSSNPNLQNIPIRTKRGREIRKAFIAEDGYQILSADYSQVELRVIAHISEDEAMKQAFQNNEDIHSRTAKEIFGLDSLDEVTSDHRRKAKEVNFGIPYGVSAYGLSSRLGISNNEGKEMIEQYFERFPGVQEYINETKAFAREHGFVKTLLGRRRFIRDIQSRNWNVRSFAERTAINTPIQGTAADIIKIAMIDIHDELQSLGCKTRMILQVHDELLFEIHEDELEELSELIKTNMEGAFELDVPLKVDMGVADNWLEAH